MNDMTVNDVFRKLRDVGNHYKLEITRVDAQQMADVLEQHLADQPNGGAADPAEQTRGNGVAAIPSSFLISKKALEGIHYMCGGDEDGAEIDDRWCEGMAWIGHLEDGDGTSSYGLHLYNADYPEEGSITIAQFVERDAPRQAVPDETDAVIEAMCRIVARESGEEFERMDVFTQQVLRGTQRQSLRAVREVAAAPSAGRMGVDRG